MRRYTILPAPQTRRYRFFSGAGEFLLTLTALLLTAFDLALSLAIGSGRLVLKILCKCVMVLLLALVFLLAYCIIMGIHTMLGSGVNSQIS